MFFVRWLGLCIALSGCASLPEPKGSGQTEGRGQHARVWNELALPGKRRTRYRVLQVDGKPVVRAEAESSASMFRRSVRLDPIDLDQVRFSWRVDELIETADLRDRDAADSPVRVLLAFDGDRSRLPARDRAMFELAQALTGEAPPYATLMYVWDNRAPQESILPGGRSDRIRKIVLESGPRHVGQWRYYTRDIAADFRRAFGEKPGALTSVGLMTDSDNTRSNVRAWYGEVRFCVATALSC